jgi:hypothetical protein
VTPVPRIVAVLAAIALVAAATLLGACAAP